MLLTAPRAKPIDDVEALAEPEGWVTNYSTRDFAYRVNLSARACNQTIYLGEAVPAVAPDLAPNCLALFLGCRGVEQPGTVWCEPFIDDPSEARFSHDPANFYWQFCLRLALEQLRLGEEKLLPAFPDLIEGLDTLAAMRGTERLLVDLIERPEWVQACLRQITDLYFRHYDVLYDMFRDDGGGSVFWAWAPGRMAKFQCDFSAMISPDMFGEFMAPVLTEMSERVSYCMYHWDGPSALAHHDHLLAIPRLQVLQWTPGAGAATAADPVWWPYFHKTVDAGKRVFIGLSNIAQLRPLKNEFGEKLNSFMIGMGATSEQQGREILDLVSED